MRQFLTLCLLVLIIPSFIAFDCNSLENQQFCEQFNDCSWDEDTRCIGNFSPSCAPPVCYFVDPGFGDDSHDGSSLTPLQTLSCALQKLQGQNGDINIINHKPDINVELLGHAVISSAITIKYI